MLQVKRAFQFQPREDKDAHRSLGIIHAPAKTVKDAARGIEYEQGAGYFAQTWLGNIQMAPGDWLVTCGSGNRYVIKQCDYFPGFGKVSFWQRLWRTFK